MRKKKVMATVTTAVVTNDLAFKRRRHLLFATIGLVHGPVVTNLGAIVVWLGATGTSVEIAAIESLAQLCFAAFVAWLAFAVFDTNAGVTIWPKRWSDIGWQLAVLLVMLECGTAWIVRRNPALHLENSAGWMSLFTDGHGHIHFDWALVLLLGYPIAEEIVYRALLLRALEGYMRPVAALIVQATVFEAVHVFVYGYGSITGLWFFYGYTFGCVFIRTRSLAAPALVHATHNIVYFASVWAFNR
jgi:membrane protease YdiL (CAAX protease family)